MSKFETEYFRLCGVTERTRAREASIPDLVAIHENLALRYEGLVKRGAI